LVSRFCSSLHLGIESFLIRLPDDRCAIYEFQLTFLIISNDTQCLYILKCHVSGCSPYNLMPRFSFNVSTIMSITIFMISILDILMEFFSFIQMTKRLQNSSRIQTSGINPFFAK